MDLGQERGHGVQLAPPPAQHSLGPAHNLGNLGEQHMTMMYTRDSHARSCHHRVATKDYVHLHFWEQGGSAKLSSSSHSLICSLTQKVFMGHLQVPGPAIKRWGHQGDNEQKTLIFPAGRDNKQNKYDIRFQQVRFQKVPGKIEMAGGKK